MVFVCMGQIQLRRKQGKSLFFLSLDIIALPPHSDPLLDGLQDVEVVVAFSPSPTPVDLPTAITFEPLDVSLFNLSRAPFSHPLSMSSRQDMDSLFLELRPGDIIAVYAHVPQQETTEGKAPGPVVRASHLQILNRWIDEHDHAFLSRTQTGQVTLPGLVAPRAPSLTSQLLGHVCKFWTSNCKCNKGEHCPWKHCTGAELVEMRKAWYQCNQRRREKKRAEPLPESMDNDVASHGSKERHGERARVFCEWLVSVYGLAFLQSGSGVIDVAGGRGDVCVELALRGIKCTLVEPRWRKLSKTQRHALAVRGLDTSAPFVHLKTKLDDAFTEQADHVQLLQGASVLVGLHPDQATEAIVDTALRWNKPFAIVPCCVFTRGIQRAS
jgi:hypothetical protein